MRRVLVAKRVISHCAFPTSEAFYPQCRKPFLSCQKAHCQLRYASSASQPVKKPKATQQDFGDAPDSFGTLNRKFIKEIRARNRPQPQKLPRVDSELVPLVFDDFKKGFEAPVYAKELEHDVFGTISDPDWQRLQQLEDADEEDVGEQISYKERPYWYMIQMRKRVRAGDLPGALEFFEIRMGKEDQVRPLRAVYDMLIAACGRAGYLDKAFELYSKMKSRRFDPHDATYVGLVNACAECPFPEEAMRRLKNLREELQRKLHTPNHLVYHSMIKAYGRCADVVSAFQIADEMLSNKLELQDQTFCFLFMACISDKQAGFKHAIEVWRFMVQCGVKPNLYHYSLLMRAARDCNLGSKELAMELLPPSVRELLNSDSGSQNQLPSGNSSSSDCPVHLQVDNSKMLPFVGTSIIHEIMEEKNRLEAEKLRKDPRFSPDIPPRKSKDTSGHYQSVMRTLLAEEYHRVGLIKKGEWWESPASRGMVPGKTLSASYGMVLVGSTAIPDLLLPFESQANTGVIAIGEAQTGHERLALLGGYSGVLSRMQRDQVKPDKKFLSLLVEVLPPNSQAEYELVELVDRLKMKVDVDFFNMIIRHRTRRSEYASALEMRTLFESRGLKSNIMTFGCLAAGCRNNHDVHELLEDMKARDLDPNIVIFNALIANACGSKRIGTLLFLMHEMKKWRLPAEEYLLKKLEGFRNEVQRAIIAKEKGRATDMEVSYLTEKFMEKWTKFKMYYKVWLGEVPAKQKEHPYAPYQYTVDEEDENDDSWREGKIRVNLHDDDTDRRKRRFR